MLRADNSNSLRSATGRRKDMELDKIDEET